MASFTSLQKKNNAYTFLSDCRGNQLNPMKYVTCNNHKTNASTIKPPANEMIGRNNLNSLRVSCVWDELMCSVRVLTLDSEMSRYWAWLAKDRHCDSPATRHHIDDLSHAHDVIPDI